MTNTVRAVVARYSEKLDWLEELGLPYVVYNKGDDSLPGAVRLPNVGRESHTYLTHIVNNYDILDHYTIFLQGEPFFHLTAEGDAGPEELKTMIMDGISRNTPFQGFAWFKLKCDGLGNPHNLRKPENKGRWAGWGKDIPVADIFTELFNADPPRQFIARASTGNFMVSAERIRTRPLGFYKHALRLIEEDPQDMENTGHAFERLWQLIFNGNTAWNKEVY